MSIYTANGDKGTTNLVHTKNVSKSDDRIQLVGTIDELSSHLGLIKTMMSEAEDIRFIENIQRTLNAVCSGVADPFNREFRTEDDRTGQLEEEISRLEGLFHCPKEENILPGSSRLSAELDIARAVARRAERDLAAVSVKFGADNGAKKYMNRLSDYLYVMARYMETTEQPVQKKEEITPFGGKEAEPVVAVQTPMTDEAVIQEVLKRMGIQGRITLDAAKRLIDKIEQEEGSNSKGKIMDLILPVVVLIALTVGTMIYTGFLGGVKNVISAFANCDAEVSLVFASTVTLIFMLILYIPRRIMTFQKFMESLAEGFKLMIPSILILVFAWSLKGVGDALQISAFVENTLGGSVTNGVIIPMVMFMIAIFLAFSTGSSWGTFAILIPIVTAIFSGGGNMEMMVISISAVLAGAVCGDHVSPISDTTIMSSAGAQCHHIDHVSTQMQYAIVVAVVCVFGYLIAGFVQVWWIVLLISVAVLLTTLTIMRKYVNKKHLKK